MNQIRKLAKKIFIISLGVMTFLFLLELSIRGYSFITAYSKPQNTTIPEHSKVILCVGNSFTLGDGAPKGESYPDHLQRMLDRTYGSAKFHVVNAGRGAFNTALILETLDQFMRENKPQIVLLQVGEPNDWNFYGFNRFLGEKGTVLKSFLDQLHKRSASYRFFRFLFAAYTEKHSEEQYFGLDNLSEGGMRRDYFHDETYRKIQNLLMANCRLDLYRPQGCQKKEELPEISTFISYAKNLNSLYPQDSDPLKALMSLNLFNGNIEVGFKFFNELINKNPKLTEVAIEQFVKFAGIDKSHELFLSISKSRPDVIEFFKLLYLNKGSFYRIIEKWIYSDIKEMISIVRSYGATPILINYPPIPYGGQRKADYAMRRMAKEENIFFVEVTEQFLRDVQYKKLKTEDYYEMIGKIPQMHLNGNGYKLEASYIFDYLSQHVIQESILNSAPKY